MKSYRFPSVNWFDVIIEAESYEKAKQRYNQFRKREHKLT